MYSKELSRAKLSTNSSLDSTLITLCMLADFSCYCHLTFFSFSFFAVVVISDFFLQNLCFQKILSVTLSEC